MNEKEQLLDKGTKIFNLKALGVKFTVFSAVEEEKRLQMSQKGGFNAIGFKYEDSSPQIAPEPTQPVSNFQPPFDIPRGMKAPDDEKVHQIIDRTANFIRSASVQSEALEKIRSSQEANPNLQFLKQEHPLFPYFEFLLKSDQQRQQAIILAKVDPKMVQVETSGASYTVPVVANPVPPTQLPPQSMLVNIQRFVSDYMAVYGGDGFVNAVRRFVMTQGRNRLREKFAFLNSTHFAYAYLRYFAFEEKGILIAEKDPEHLQKEHAEQEAEKKKAERRAKAKLFLAQQSAATKAQAELSASTPSEKAPGV
jgi:hypothetical protein